jgi:hypothetical protein
MISTSVSSRWTGTGDEVFEYPTSDEGDEDDVSKCEVFERAELFLAAISQLRLLESTVFAC